MFQTFKPDVSIFYFNSFQVKEVIRLGGRTKKKKKKKLNYEFISEVLKIPP